jgi:hypothetical protein
MMAVAPPASDLEEFEPRVKRPEPLLILHTTTGNLKGDYADQALLLLRAWKLL